MKRNLKQFGLGTVLAMTICIGKVALAGERGGNGGDAVVCPDRVLMLDSYEVVKAGKEVSLGTGDLAAMVKTGIDRIGAHDQILKRILQKDADLLITDVEAFERTGIVHQKNTYFTTDTLVNVPDEGVATIPAGCTIEQLIIQVSSPLPKQPRFIFRSDIWLKMSTVEKAMGILHEAIYGHALKHVTSSELVRYFNRLIATGEVLELTNKEYIEFVVANLPEQKFELNKLRSSAANLFYDTEGKAIGTKSGEILEDLTISSNLTCLAGSQVFQNFEKDLNCLNGQLTYAGAKVVGQFFHNWDGEKWNYIMTIKNKTTVKGVTLPAGTEIKLNSELNSVAFITGSNEFKLGTEVKQIRDLVRNEKQLEKVYDFKFSVDKEFRARRIYATGNGMCGGSPLFNFDFVQLRFQNKKVGLKSCVESTIIIDEDGNVTAEY